MQRSSHETSESKHRSRAAVARYVLFFAVLVALGHALVYSPIVDRLGAAGLRRSILDAHGSAITRVSALLLSVAGLDVQAAGHSIVGEGFSIALGKGCDAIPPTLLVIGAIGALPVRWTARLAGLALLIAAMQLLNVVRVAALFLVGLYWRSAFAVMHEQVWPAIFILFAVGGWILWAAWAVRQTGRPAAAAPQEA